MIASSGIDNVVKLWQNMDDYPTERTLEQRNKRIQRFTRENQENRDNDSDNDLYPVCLQQ